MQKIKHNAYWIMMIIVLFVTGLSFVSFFQSQGKVLVSSVSAEEEKDESSKDKEDNQEDESDNDRDEKEDEDEKDKEKDVEDEGSRESEKKNIRVRKAANTQSESTKIANDEDEDREEGIENEKDDDNDLSNDLKDLNKAIAKVETKIAILASAGVSVDALQDSLSEVKNLASQVKVGSQDGKEVLNAAENKLERLEKLVKMSLKDDDEDEESAEEATEEIQELERDLNKLENKLNIASNNGVDVIAYRSILTDVRATLFQAKEKLDQGLYVEAEAMAELASKKLDKTDDIIEDLFEDDEEDDTADEYKNEVALFVHNLKELSEIEDGIGQQVRLVAQAQNDSKDEVENNIKEIESQGDVAKFFVGPKYANINEVEAAIAENQNRIKVLSEAMNQIADLAVKQVLQDQITLLTQQNSNLQKFVAESKAGFSLFGWLFKMIA